MEEEESLIQSIENYKNQIAKVNKCIEETTSNTKLEELLSLRDNLEVLLKLTEESLSETLTCDNKEESTSCVEEDPFEKEYALFKAELSLDEESHSSEKKDDDKESTSKNHDESEMPSVNVNSIQDELDSLIGKKCQAPYTNKYNSQEYYNALVVGIEISNTISDLNHIKVRVLFTNPTERDMVPCPYFLDNKCNFSEEDCNFSHGYLVSFGDLKEYREPDFSRLKVGSRVLAKIGNLKIWKPTVIEDITSDEIVLVKHEGNFSPVPIHDILPLTNDDEESELSSESEDEIQTFNSHHDYMVELSLTRQPQSGQLGDWEKFTKGIGSKLMAKMGYIVGTGLGKNGEGRLAPVEAVVLPAGKSLDHCMNLKEAAGGSKDLFSAEKIQNTLSKKELRKSRRAYMRDKNREKHDVFNFINTKLNQDAKPSSSLKRNNEKFKNKLKTTSGRELNVERLKISEDMREIQRSIYVLSESLTRQKPDSISHKNILTQLRDKEDKLASLRNLDQKVEREQTLRETKRKMTVF